MSRSRTTAHLTPGDHIPELRRVVTTADVAAYAEAGGDRNPLHLDAAAARDAGFPGIIAHGMFTMGHMAACAVAWAGDPAAIVRISAQFRAPVSMGDEITAAGRIKEIDHVTDTVVLDMWVTLERDGQTERPIKKGEVTVSLG